MQYIESPHPYTWINKSLFIAGWISGCPDWQTEFKSFFKDSALTLLNPRREHYDINNKAAEIEQITWEHEHLEKADIISFWFWKETICPIVLYELGKYITSNKEIYLWIDPQYQRKSDVEIQMSLIKPDLKVVYSIKNLAMQVLETL